MYENICGLIPKNKGLDKVTALVVILLALVFVPSNQ